MSDASDEAWVVLQTVGFAHEADWLRDHLESVGIEARTPDSLPLEGLDDGPAAPVRVLVRASDRERALAALADASSDGHVARAEHEGALRTYQEWAAHRYDPGHFLGGTLEPHLRIAELGPRARKYASYLLGGSFVSLSLSVLALEAGDWSWMSAPSIALMTLYAVAALRMGSR